MTYFDYGLIAVILTSGLIGFIRGVTAEVLGFASWLGAGLASYYGFHLIRPYVQNYISSPMIADGVSIFLVFVFFLILLSLITHALSNVVKNSMLSQVDRALGLGYGFARGIVIGCIINVAAGMLVARPQQPTWIQQARFLPFLDNTSNTLMMLIPGDTKNYIVGQTLKNIDEFAKKQLQEQAKEQLQALNNPSAIFVPGQNPKEALDPQKAAEALAKIRPQLSQTATATLGPSYKEKDFNQLDRLLEDPEEVPEPVVRQEPKKEEE
ncbi:MAG TPA: CvpA family protein [Alphaproteobacteria bacterium]|nr:CvpA family protein [Alphaproteobacteria bacterium]